MRGPEFVTLSFWEQLLRAESQNPAVTPRRPLFDQCDAFVRAEPLHLVFLLAKHSVPGCFSHTWCIGVCVIVSGCISLSFSMEKCPSESSGQWDVLHKRTTLVPLSCYPTASHTLPLKSKTLYPFCTSSMTDPMPTRTVGSILWTLCIFNFFPT